MNLPEPNRAARPRSARAASPPFDYFDIMY